MVAILDPPAFLSGIKVTSLRARLKTEENALEKSLRHTPSMDPELDCLLDSCSEDSYSSSADYSSSSGSSSGSFPGFALTMSNLRCSTSAPLVQNTFVNVTTPKKAVIAGSPTCGKLTQLLHDHDTLASSARELAPSPSLTPPSPRLFQMAWQMLPRKLTIRFALRPNTILDASNAGQEDGAVGVDQGEFLSQEAHNKVFEARSPAESAKARVRECRMNKDFLRIYALDYSARVAGTLPASTSDYDMSHHRQLDQIVGLDLSDEDDELEYECERQRISQVSQDKLWSCAILLPRTDPPPCRTIDSSSYVRAAGTSGGAAPSLAKALPIRAMKPAGQMKCSRCLRSANCPYLGCTVPQYTLIGWENRRWALLH